MVCRIGIDSVLVVGIDMTYLKERVSAATVAEAAAARRACDPHRLA